LSGFSASLGANRLFLLLGSISQGRRDFNHDQLIDSSRWTREFAGCEDDIIVMIESLVDVVTMVEGDGLSEAVGAPWILVDFTAGLACLV
jgi:hypothetical protein